MKKIRYIGRTICGAVLLFIACAMFLMLMLVVREDEE